VSGLGAVQYRAFAMTSGEVLAEAFAAFVKLVFDHLADHSADNAIHFICLDRRHMARCWPSTDPATS
jgi:hypothetical protein